MITLPEELSNYIQLGFDWKMLTASTQKKNGIHAIYS